MASGSSSIEPGKYEHALEPLSWLFGKWASMHGKGHCPVFDQFEYAEEAEFAPIYKTPVIEYKLQSRNPKTNKPFHRESGFIKYQPETKTVSVQSAHINGLAEVLEGKLDGYSLSVETIFMARCSFNTQPAVKQVCRSFSLRGDKLEQVMSLETVKTPKTEHVRIIYDRVSESRGTPL